MNTFYVHTVKRAVSCLIIIILMMKVGFTILLKGNILVIKYYHQYLIQFLLTGL